ncbi:MAG: hypothetical protein JXA42_23035 [Anaerolineales bacterium]|nr:hypothetical protein [Anaerolineales bacterium]
MIKITTFRQQLLPETSNQRVAPARILRMLQEGATRNGIHEHFVTTQPVIANRAFCDEAISLH